MRRIYKNIPLIVIACVLLVGGAFLGSSLLAGDNPDPNRFRNDIDKFIEQDKKHPEKTSSIVFVGSSSIRGWDTEKSFPKLPIAQRGFGGSHISDVNYFIEPLVLKHSPDIVVLYAGENDISHGKNPKEVFRDFKYFVDAVYKQSTETHIVFLSIKPTPARWRKWPKMIETNNMIKTFTEKSEKLHYVDIASPMIGKDGKPIDKLYMKDQIHMTAEGYAIWDEKVRSILSGILEPAAR